MVKVAPKSLGNTDENGALKHQDKLTKHKYPPNTEQFEKYIGGNHVTEDSQVDHKTE